MSYGLSRCAEHLRPGRLRRNIAHGGQCRIERTSDVRFETVRDLVGDTVEWMALATRSGFLLEPRCRVCRNDQLRTRRNDVVAA